MTCMYIETLNSVKRKNKLVCFGDLPQLDGLQDFVSCEDCHHEVEIVDQPCSVMCVCVCVCVCV